MAAVGFTGTLLGEAQVLSNVAKYFAYPDTEIVLTIGKAIHKIDVKSHQVPQSPTDRPIFRSGGGSGGGLGSLVVGYEFVGRFDQGDVYVFTVKKQLSQDPAVPIQEEVIRVVPLVYGGTETAAFEQGEVKAVIRPKRLTRLLQ